MNKVVIISFLFIVSFAKAQELNAPLYTIDSASNEAGIRFKGYYHNNGLTNEFLNLFYAGGYLDTNLKNETFQNLLAENRIGAEMSYGLFYKNHRAHLFGKPDWGWFASSENYGFHHARYSDNAFSFLFYGNSQFEGDTIALHDVSFESMQYQKFTLGGFHKTNHSFIGISFLKGQNYSQLDMRQADFYTAPMGEEVSLNLQANYTQSDTINRSLSAFNGWGISTDLVFYLNIGKNRNVKFENAFRIAIQDLGFIRWNENSMYTQYDSSYYFNGFEVEDLFDSASYQISDRIKDSLSFHPLNRAMTTMLPFSFSFSKIADPNAKEKWQGIYGFRIRANAFYKPLFYAGLFYQPIKNMNMNVYASVGGYGKFRVGYGIYACVLKKGRISLSSSDLIGWTKNGNGKDVSLNVSYAF